jgi:hypothetical protein
MRLVLFALVGFLTLSATSHATPISFSLENPSREAFAGDIVVFQGVITNLSNSTLTASDFFFSFSGFDADFLMPDQLLGLTNFVLPPFTFSAITDLFSVSITPDALPGPYPIEVLLINVNDEISDLVAAAITVRGIPTSVPEPGSFVLFFIGLTIMASTCLRTRSRRAYTAI